MAASVARGEDVLSLELSPLPEMPDPSAHPEMCAVRAAAAREGSRYLAGAVLYSTLEPCPMCVSVAIWAKMDGIVFGVSPHEGIEFARSRATPTLTWRQIAIPASTIAEAGSPRLWVQGGVLREECFELLELTATRTRSRAASE